jgi:hypothetical protein
MCLIELVSDSAKPAKKKTMPAKTEAAREGVPSVATPAPTKTEAVEPAGEISEPVASVPKPDSTDT